MCSLRKSIGITSLDCRSGTTPNLIFRNKHVDAVAVRRPPDQEASVRKIIGLACKLDRLVTDQRDAAGFCLRDEKALQVGRRLDHLQLAQRQPAVGEWVFPVRQFNAHLQAIAAVSF